MDDTRTLPQGADGGEGSRTADQQNRKAADELARRADSLQKALEAERDVENYRDEYDRTKPRRVH